MELSTSRRDLYEAVGLHPLGGKQQRDHSLRVSDEQAARICAATGIRERDIQQLTVARYAGRVLFLRETREGVDIHFLWARGSGSRYCPACLREAPGVWKLAWRLSWSFACTRHRVLLLDGCSGCGLIPGSRPRLGDVPVPNLCGNAVCASNVSARCWADLSQGPLVYLPAGSTILAAQSWLEAAIESRELSSGDLQRLLNDLKMLAGRALRVMSAEDLRKWNRTDQVPGLDFEIDRGRRRTGLFHPDSAIATAHAVSLAARVLRSDAEGIYVPILRRLLFDHDGSAVKETPSGLIRHWGEPSSALRLKMLKALHADIRPESALRYGTAGPSPSTPSMDRAHILERARSVPQRFWPGWVNSLQFDSSAGPKMLQTALSIGVLLPGYDESDLSLQRETLGLSRKNNSFSSVCRGLPPPERDELMTALLALASYLDEHPAPIDYDRRRRLSLDGLLPVHIWQDIATPNGRGGNDPAAARVYLAYRLTGSIPEHTERGGQGYFLVQNFLASTPSGILDLLDERARTFLAENHVVEPLSWEPPAGLLRGSHYARQQASDNPIFKALIQRGLIEPRLIRQIEHRAVKSVRALIPEPDSFEARLRQSLDRGESVESMAVSLKKSRRMIIHHVSRLGLPRPQSDKAPLDPGRIRDMYVVQRRTAQEIADATGWARTTIRRILLLEGVTLRGVGGHSGRIGIDPERYSAFPALLKRALPGPQAKARLERFAVVSTYPTLDSAVSALGLNQPALVRQIKALERDVGGTLLTRAHGKRPMLLTELGSTLVELARGHGIVICTGRSIPEGADR